MKKCAEVAFATDKYQTLPGWVLKEFCALDDAVNEVTNPQKKAMKKDVSKSYIYVKTNLKNYLS